MVATIIIDRKKIQVDGDPTILEAARSAGIHIPTLCYHAELSPIGSCRVCLVEVDGVANPVTSCNTKVSDGMAIRTDSERIRSMRRAMVELLLIDHPLECPVCDKAGECELQDIVHELGLMQPQYEPIGAEREVSEINTFIGRYPNRCLVCGRCVRACEEIQGAGVMNYVKREGYEGEVAMVARDPIECEQCGQCLRVCPVGALIEQQFKYRARAWELDKTSTTCPYCGLGCTLTLNVKQGRIFRVTSETPGLSKGNLCVRGRFGLGFVESGDRLEYPMIREGGKLRRAGWEEALDLVATKLGDAKQSAGPEAIAVFGSPRCTNEDNYQLQKFARVALGTNNIDFAERAPYSGSLKGIADVFGTETATTNTVSAIEGAKAVLVVDTDVSESQPILALPVLKAVRRNGASLVVIDSRRTKLARHASHWLDVRPGSEEMVVGAIVRYVCESGRAKGPGSQDLSTLLESLAGCGLERAQEASGVEAERIARAAETFVEAGPVAVLISALGGREMGRLAADLLVVSGDAESGGVYAVGLSSNWRGALDMGVSPSRLPGGADVGDEEARTIFETAWGSELPAKAGLSVASVVEEAARGGIRAAYVMGDALSRTPTVVEALRKVDFVVVQDILAGPALEYADVVLPSTSFAEKRGTFTNMERFVQRVRPALHPRGEARSDTAILSEIARRLDMDLEPGPGAIMREISTLCPAYREVSYESLEAGSLRLSSRDGDAGEGLPEGFPRIAAASPSPPIEQDIRYPYRLVAGTRRFQAGSPSWKAAGLAAAYPEPLAEVNPADGEVLGVKDSMPILVRTPHGEASLKVKLTLKSPVGVVFVPLGVPGLDAAALMGTNGSSPSTKTVASLEKQEVGG